MKRFLPLFLLPTFGVETHHLQTKETDPTKGSCDHESEPLDSSDSWSGWWSCSNLVGGWKIWVKLDHSPQGSGQNQKHLKPTIPEDGFFTKFELKSWNESLSWKGTETNSESHFCPFVPPCFFWVRWIPCTKSRYTTLRYSTEDSWNLRAAKSHPMCACQKPLDRSCGSQ